MTPAAHGNDERSAHPWWLVLCLVGLDYFSTLAYLPSLAVAAAGKLAPLAALAVVLATVLLALPAYSYVVGRSAGGRGAAGLVEQVIPGWGGKLLVLTLLGFAAADFVVTRSLSVADAAMHLTHNPQAEEILDRLPPLAESFHRWIGSDAAAWLSPLFSRQVAVTLGMTVLSFAFWQLLQRGFTRTVLRLAAAVVSIYLVVVGIVVGNGLWYLLEHGEIWQAWWNSIEPNSTGFSRGKHPLASIAAVAAAALWAFPQLALGLSGFELTMTITPLVQGGAQDSAEDPRQRIRNTRKLLCTAVAIMTVLLLGSVLVTTLLVPPDALAHGGLAEDRALAWLAHGGALADGQPGSRVNGSFGSVFGGLYDAITIVILSLAGASVVISLREMLPHYLHRLGMAITWAGQTGAIMHVLNGIILIVTLVFHASLAAQQWAYATSVLVLLAGAAVAAAVDVSGRIALSPARWIAVAYLALTCGFFLLMTAVTTCTHPSGVVIALAFVATIVVTSFISRWLRSTELRFEGFSFRDDTAQARWEAICRREFQVVAPHRPGLTSLAEKNCEIRRDFRLSPDTPVLFVEATLGDPSEFYQQPLLAIDDAGGLEVVRVSKCVSIAHVLASLCLALCNSDGRPPEVIFGWSNERPLAANLNFLLLGEGNIPWLVRELVRQAAPDVRRRPRIHIG